jgi:hypothetical protein
MFLLNLVVQTIFRGCSYSLKCPITYSTIHTIKASSVFYFPPSFNDPWYKTATIPLLENWACKNGNKWPLVNYVKKDTQFLS